MLLPAPRRRRPAVPAPSAPRYRGPVIRCTPVAPPVVAAAPLAVDGLDLRRRWASVEARVEAAARAGARLLLLPEAALTGYRQAPGEPAVARQARVRLAGLAHDHGLWLAAGLVDAVGSALDLVAPDGRRWTYHKRWPTWTEARAWAPGTGPVVAPTELGRVALLICADLLQPAAARSWGAVDLVLVAGAWPDHAALTRISAPMAWGLGPAFRRSGTWRRGRLAALARSTGATVLWANGSGEIAPGERFGGDAAVLGPDGSVLTEGHHTVSAPLQRGAPQPVPWPLDLRLFSAAHRVGAALRRL